MKTFEKWIPMANPPMRSAQQPFYAYRKVQRAGKNHIFYSKWGSPIAPFPLQNTEYKIQKRDLAIKFFEVRGLYHEIIAEPIFVTMAIIMPYLKLDIKAGRTSLIPKVTTPDIDNGTIKMYLDAMQPFEHKDKNGKVLLSLPGLIEDDKYVVQVDASKWRGPHPGIYLKIEPADPQAMFKRMRDHIEELRGKDIFCWCKLPEPCEDDTCHGSFLLSESNKPKGTT